MHSKIKTGSPGRLHVSLDNWALAVIRAGKGGKGVDESKEIKVTQEWWDRLNKLPFISCKYMIYLNLNL